MKRTLLLPCAALLSSAAVALPPPADSAPVAHVTGKARVDRLLARMTLDEKLTLLAGTADASRDPQYQAGYLPGIARLGIPPLKLADGPAGVISKQDSTGMTATMGVAATFSIVDAKANGVVIGRDAKAIGQDVVLEPFVNLDRDISGGRGGNTLGEDPLLAGAIGAAEVVGIQSQGALAQVKHYLAFDGASNVQVDEQTLHEIYLQPFAATVDAGAASIMCAGGMLNGHYKCDNAESLTEILRNELGFKGWVNSDWWVTHAPTDLNAGVDMAMPGSGGPAGFAQPQTFSKAALRAAIDSGSIQVSRVNEAVGRILYQYDRFGLLDGKSKHTITPLPTRADNKIVQQTGEDAATLLKNDDHALPLGDGSIALIGPGAGQTIATFGGGEKSGGIVSEQVGPYQVLRRQLGTRVSFAVGNDMTGSPVPASALSHDGQPGLLRNDSKVDGQLNFTDANGASLHAGANVVWSGTLTAPVDGEYWLNIQAMGGTANLSVDGKSLTIVGAATVPGFKGLARYGRVHASDGNGPLPTTDGLANGRALIALSAGPHSLSVTETADASGAPVQVRLNWVTPADQKANHDAAVAAARSAKTAVVFVWAGARTDVSRPLAEDQDALVADIAAVNPNTVVVLNTSQPIAMPWLDKVKAVLEMWYPGDPGGYATANVLTGKVNPGGKLPFTWPTSLDQGLAQQPDHPERASNGVDSAGKLCGPGAGGPGGGTTCVTTYSEGVNIGYRYFDASSQTPRYPFGFGLSYTSFSYSGMQAAPSRDGGLDVSFQIRNTGSTAGDAVPQIYLGAPATKPAGVQFAAKTLAAFARLHLEPGQSKTVSIHVPKRQLQYWSPTAGWTTATGERPVTVSTSERTDALRGTITIN